MDLIIVTVTTKGPLILAVQHFYYCSHFIVRPLFYSIVTLPFQTTKISYCDKYHSLLRIGLRKVRVFSLLFQRRISKNI